MATKTYNIKIDCLNDDNSTETVYLDFTTVLTKYVIKAFQEALAAAVREWAEADEEELESVLDNWATTSRGDGSVEEWALANCSVRVLNEIPEEILANHGIKFNSPDFDALYDVGESDNLLD